MDDFDVLEALIKTALAVSHVPLKRNAWLMSLLENPKFEEVHGSAGWGHDWRRYVHPSVQTVWPHMPTMARLTAYIAAETQADAYEPRRD